MPSNKDFYSGFHSYWHINRLSAAFTRSRLSFKRKFPQSNLSLLRANLHSVKCGIVLAEALGAHFYCYFGVRLSLMDSPNVQYGYQADSIY